MDPRIFLYSVDWGQITYAEWPLISISCGGILAIKKQ